MLRSRKLQVLSLAGLGVLGLVIGFGAFIGLRYAANTRSAEAQRNCVQIANEFSDYPLVFLGPQFQGLPLTGCQRDVTPDKYDLDGSVREPATDMFSFIYGTRKLPPGDEARCAPPVQVFVS